MIAKKANRPVRKPRIAAKKVHKANLVATVKDSSQEIWLAGLGAFAKTQDEGRKVFEALVAEGLTLNSKVREAADTVTGRFSDKRVSELTERVVGSWSKFGQMVEGAATDALGRVGVATKSEIATLARRVGKLASDVEALATPVKKPVATRRRATVKA
jgi:poly(hydroxyalkanoate) granule-associated protein